MDENLLEGFLDANPETEASTEQSVEKTDNTNVATPTTEEQGEKSVLDELKELPTEEQKDALMGEISKLNLIRNGLPLEYESKEQVVEALQKWKDYETKTKEVATQREQFEKEFKEKSLSFENERKQFEAEKSEMATKLNEYSLFEQALLEMQNADPDTFGIVKDYFQRQAQSYRYVSNNPETLRLKNELSEIKARLGKYESGQAEKKVNEIRSGWEEGVNQVRSDYGAKLKSLGIKEDWKSVQDIYAADATGKMSVKSAFLARHGEEITKALESQKKLADTKAKSSSRLGPEKKVQTPALNKNMDSFMDDLSELAKKLA